MENADRLTWQIGIAWPSGSRQPVVFSATEGVALEVITGSLSFTGVTVTLRFCTAVRPAPSLAVTWT